MKRDMDLCRSILLDLEAQTADLGDSNFGFDHTSAATRVKTSYDTYSNHLNLLYQAGFVEGWVKRGKARQSGPDAKTEVVHDYVAFVMPRGITWDGYEYLETIRDPEIWRKTQAGATRLGNFSIDVIKELALGFVKQKIKQHTGVEIDI